MRERLLAHGLGLLRRTVDVTRAVLLVADQALLAEDAQDRAYGGVGRRIGEVLHDLGHRGLAAAVQDVHDLSLAAREVSGVGTSGHKGPHMERDVVASRPTSRL